MYTRCPSCHTLFRIQARQLKAARGRVRCGECNSTFDALEYLVNPDELSKEEIAATVTARETVTRQQQLPFDDTPSIPHKKKRKADDQKKSGEPPAGKAPLAEASVVPTAEKPEENPEPQAETHPGKAPPEVAKPAHAKPLQAEPQHPRYALASAVPADTHTGTRLVWALGSLVMIALLAGQLAFLNRDTLALDPRWRPWLKQFCDAAGCTLAPLRDPKAIEMVDRNVQSHPKYQNALLITATLVNQAPFAQPYPEVELSMTDLDQKRIASRRFLPPEYIENGTVPGLIPPGASVRLKLEIADPGQEAVGFEFGFF